MAYQFNPQVGATTIRSGKGGWEQSLGIQSSIGMGAERRRLAEERRQRESELAMSREQFDTRLGWEQEKFAEEREFAQKQQRYTEKREKKAERIGQFGLGLSVGELGLNLANTYEIDLDKGFTSPKTGGGQTVQQADVQGGRPTSESGSLGEAGGQLGTTVGTGMVAGTAGSFVTQAIFGEGKTQSTIGGALAGGTATFGATGNWYSAAGGAFVGGLLGYFLG